MKVRSNANLQHYYVLRVPRNVNRWRKCNLFSIHASFRQSTLSRDVYLYLCTERSEIRVTASVIILQCACYVCRMTIKKEEGETWCRSGTEDILF